MVCSTVCVLYCTLLDSTVCTVQCKLVLSQAAEEEDVGHFLLQLRCFVSFRFETQKCDLSSLTGEEIFLGEDTGGFPRVHGTGDWMSTK